MASASPSGTLPAVNVRMVSFVQSGGLDRSRGPHGCWGGPCAVSRTQPPPFGEEPPPQQLQADSRPYETSAAHQQFFGKGLSCETCPSRWNSSRITRTPAGAPCAVTRRQPLHWQSPGAAIAGRQVNLSVGARVLASCRLRWCSAWWHMGASSSQWVALRHSFMALTPTRM